MTAKGIRTRLVCGSIGVLAALIIATAAGGCGTGLAASAHRPTRPLRSAAALAWTRNPGGPDDTTPVLAQGVLVPAGPQGAIGQVFLVTSDAGRAWTPVRRGRPRLPSESTVEFVSLNVAFAWNPDAQRPPSSTQRTAAGSGRPSRR